MTSQQGSYPGPSRPDDHLIGQEWVEHGYITTPIFEEVDDCPICDAPNQTCTDHNVYDPYANRKL